MVEDLIELLADGDEVRLVLPTEDLAKRASIELANQLGLRGVQVRIWRGANHLHLTRKAA